MEPQQKRLIFILPYLNVNTTSAERFKSFINVAESYPGLGTEVITFEYGIHRSYFYGLSTDNIDFFQPKSYRKLNVKFNYLQKIAFWSLNSGHIKLWRFFQLMHLILFRKDIFYPGNINKYFSKSKVETFVFCSGSHFSIFVTAKKLCDTFGYKLILDYRDPWTFGYTAIDGFEFVQKLKIFFGRTKEIKLLQSAFLITTVSESLRQFFPKKYSDKIEVIPNGSNFNKEDVTPNEFPEYFNLVYAGTIYNEQLKEKIFFDAFSKFIKDKDKSKIRLQFIGANRTKGLSKLIAKYDLQSVSLITPRLIKSEFVQYMNNASVFLHFRFHNKSNVISSKLAEYLNFRKPILLPVSDKGDIAQSIVLNQAGFVCRDVESVLYTLNLLWEKFERKESTTLVSAIHESQKITRLEIAKQLLEKIV